jgi:uncharacterized membrane protein
MLTPLESGFFDVISGLPLHPLVVHFAVVLLPLAALGLVLLVIVPKWADRYGLLTLLALAGGTVAAFVAKESGEALASHMGMPATHAAWGDQLPFLSVGLLVLAVAWYVLHRRNSSGGRPRSAATTILGVLAALMALVVTGVTVLVGHTGAEAAWSGTAAAGGQASVAAAPTASGSAKTPSASASASASSYTMADVAKHADASSCWSAINGNVYDLTKWVNQHPGGPRVILGLCGKDGTSGFVGQHGGQSRPETVLKGFLLGPLS